MKNKFWYGLKSEVYVHFCKNKALVYDTQQKICEICQDRNVVELLVNAEKEDSLGCVLVDMGQQTQSVKKWIKTTLDKNMAVTFPFKEGDDRPVILRPLLSLNKDVEKMADIENGQFHLAENIKHFLQNLTIYINANCNRKCSKCKEYCKQLPFCTNFGEEKGISLTPLQLKSILNEASSFPLRCINIFGGNIYEEEALKILEEVQLKYSLPFRFNVHYLDYRKNPFVDSQEIRLLVPNDFDETLLNTVYTEIQGKKVFPLFIVEGDEVIPKIEKFINENNIDTYRITPFYTGENKDFFKKNVYTIEEDLLTTNISMREIFRNSKLNSNFFGNLYVMPNGGIKANICKDDLGKVGTDELIDVIYNELTANTAWRRIRNQEPCSQCIFQFICPPPSEYEVIIGKNNLCYMRNNNFSV